MEVVVQTAVQADLELVARGVHADDPRPRGPRRRRRAGLGGGSVLVGACEVGPGGGGAWYRESVALRRDDLTPEQLEYQRALDRSWAEAQRGLADPEFRAYLEDSIRRLDAKEPVPVLTREEFLAQTEALDG